MIDWLELPVDEDLVAFDIETSGLHPDDGAQICAVSVAFRSEGVLASFAVPVRMRRDNPTLFDTNTQNISMIDWDNFCDWLYSKQLIAHNGKFDLLFMSTEGWDLSNNLVWDTMIAAWVLDPLGEKALKKIASKLWGEDETAEQKALQPWFYKKSDPRFDQIPWSVLKPYAIKDADLTYRLYEHQWELFYEGLGSTHEFNTEMEICRLLLRMEQAGVVYDVDESRIIAERLERTLLEIAQRTPFGMTPKKAGSWFFSAHGGQARVHCRTASKNPSMSECCVKDLVKQGIPHATNYAQYQLAKNAISRYYLGLAEATGSDGKLRTNFRQAHVVTYRFSSSRVNLQALPHDYRLAALEVPSPRSLFKAESGHVLVEMDLSQAELRLGARYSGCKPIIEVFESGGDPHGETASKLFHVTPDDDEWFASRQIAKRCNFALQYGVGPDTLRDAIAKQADIHLTRPATREIIEDWHGLYPEYRQYLPRVARTVQRKRWLRLIDGKRRLFWKHEETHKAFNALIQGSIAQMMKHSMILLQDSLPAGAQILLQVHDSVVVQMPQELYGSDEMAGIVKCWETMLTEMAEINMEVDHKVW